MVFFFIFFAFLRAFGAQELICDSKAEMGTPFKICVYAEQSQALTVRQDLQTAFDMLRKIDHWMSEWRPDTELSKVNLAAGAQALPVSQELFDVVKYSLEVSDETQGAFDPTFNALWGLYNFKKGAEREATDDELKEKLPLINYHLVELDEKKHSIFLKKPGMKLGLGGIGQGYGVDRVVDFLKTKKYKAGFVDGSGDTYFFGEKPDKELWRVGVRNPFDPTKSSITIYGTDFAVTTSGDDEKFFMKNGKRIHHILDPKTGRPATLSRQVTVISKKATEADAFDTAFFILGLKKSIPISKRKKMAFVFITPDKKVTVSDNLIPKKTSWGEVFIWRND